MPIGPTGTLARYLPQFNSAALTGGAAPRAAASAAPTAARIAQTVFPTTGEVLKGAGGLIGKSAKAAVPLAKALGPVVSRAVPAAALGYGVNNIYEDMNDPNSGLYHHGAALRGRMADHYNKGQYPALAADVVLGGGTQAARVIGTALGMDFRPSTGKKATGTKATGKKPAAVPAALKNVIASEKKAAAKAQDTEEFFQLISQMTPNQVSRVMKNFKPEPVKQRSNKDIAIGNLLTDAETNLRKAMADPKRTDATVRTAYEQWVETQKFISNPNAITLGQSNR